MRWKINSEDTYREKLVTLRKSYFPENAGAQRDQSENISESADATAPVQVSGLMESYLNTLTRVAKK